MKYKQVYLKLLVLGLHIYVISSIILIKERFLQTIDLMIYTLLLLITCNQVFKMVFIQFIKQLLVNLLRFLKSIPRIQLELEQRALRQ